MGEKQFVTAKPKTVDISLKGENEVVATVSYANDTQFVSIAMLRYTYSIFDRPLTEIEYPVCIEVGLLGIRMQTGRTASGALQMI